MAVDLCPCCDTWKWKRGPRGKIAIVDSAGSTLTLNVYDLDGQRLWTADIKRHTAGTRAVNPQTAEGCCFGPNQHVYVGQMDHYTIGTAPDSYVYEYNNAGTFIQEWTVPGLLEAQKRQLRANINGHVVHVVRVFGSLDNAAILDGATGTGYGSTYGAVAIDDNDYFYALTTGQFGTTLDVQRFSLDGTLIETLASTMNTTGVTGTAMDVAKDGTYCWIAKSTLSGTYTTTFKKVAIPGGAVLDTTTTSPTGTAIKSLSISPWGTRYDTYGTGDTDTGQPDIEKVLVTTGLSRTHGVSGALTSVALSPAGTSPYHACAVSLD